jgi:tetratricopeptide (TPR) repeat protein
MSARDTWRRYRAGGGRRRKRLDCPALCEEHLEATAAAAQLLAEGAPVVQVEPANSLWLEGLEAWSQGVFAGDLEKFSEAREAWTQSLLWDPVLCDSWLGLASLDTIEGRTNIAVQRGLALSRQRLGEHQDRHQRSVIAHYQPLPRSFVVIRHRDDTLCSLASTLILANEPLAALAVLNLAERQSHPCVLVVRARAEALGGSWRTALAEAQRAERLDDASLIHVSDYRIFQGLCLDELALHHGARHLYQEAIDRAESREQRLAARWLMFSSYVLQGQAPEARIELERIYAEDVHYPQVAELLGLETRALDETERAWQAIVDRLRDESIHESLPLPDLRSEDGPVRGRPFDQELD